MRKLIFVLTLLSLVLTVSIPGYARNRAPGRAAILSIPTEQDAILALRLGTPLVPTAKQLATFTASGVPYEDLAAVSFLKYKGYVYASVRNFAELTIEVVVMKTNGQFVTTLTIDREIADPV